MPTTSYILTNTLQPGQEYLVANGNSGSVYLMSNQSGGARVLTGVAATISNNAITIDDSIKSTVAFNCILYTAGNNVTTTLESNGSYLYVDNANGLRFEPASSLNRFWHYNNGKFWQFKNTTSDGYTDTSTEYKYFLELNASNGFTDNHVDTTSIQDSTIPLIYLFVEDDGTGIDVTGISLNKNTDSIEVGATSQLTETITPSNATNQGVSWSSSDTSVATVDAFGLVTGVSVGTAVITVTTINSNQTAQCVVTVTQATLTDYVLTNTLQAGKEYLIATGGSAGTYYLLSNESGGTRILNSISATMTNNKLSITNAVKSKVEFNCVLYTNGNNVTTTIEKNGSYLYVDNANGLRFDTIASLNRFWHYNGGKFWQFQSTTDDGYTDASTDLYKYYLTLNNMNNFTDGYITSPSVQNSTMPYIYLFVKDDGTNTNPQPITPTSAEIRTLKNADGSMIIYPETSTEAIFSPAFGTNLEDMLLNMGGGSSTPVDLSTLVHLAGNETITGHKTFTSNTMQANYPIIDLQQTGTVSGYTGGHGIDFLLPNITNTGVITPIWSGQSSTTGNSAGMQIFWKGDNANDSHMAFSFYAKNGLMRIYNSGNVSIGEDNNNYKLNINGSTNTTGTLYIRPTGNNYTEGIRIDQSTTNPWCGIVLKGSDNLSDTGTSTKTWSILNNDGTFYINKNGSTQANVARAMATSTGWVFGNPAYTDSGFNVDGFQCSSSSYFHGRMYISTTTSIANNYSAGITFRVNQTDNSTGFANNGAFIEAYDDHDASNSGLNMVIGAHSNLVIGAGESARSFYNAELVNSAAEQMYITSDNAIRFYTNCNTIANRKMTMWLQGNVAVLEPGVQLQRGGNNVSWIQGRTGAMIKQTTYTGYNPILSMKTTNGSWQLGPYSNDILYFSYTTDTNFNANSNTSVNTVNLRPDGKIYGAVWNDYAEYREMKNIAESGRVVKEVGNDSLILATERLQYGCEIVSDTFGLAIGETDNCNTPIAVSGRVLAYPYEDRKEFYKNVGRPVCSGPNGTVSIMTEEEEKLYPGAIIGTISAVPEYETWGSGNVKVNNRVWIRVR